MKLVKASCPCGFTTKKVRWGRDGFRWWFPTYNAGNGSLAEMTFALPEDERHRLLLKCTEKEITARCQDTEQEIIGQLRTHSSSENAAGGTVFINDHDLGATVLNCPQCHEETLRLRPITVWANCRVGCGNRYQWADSLEHGCPTCGHRPHSFEIDGEATTPGGRRCVCWCACSSHTVCRSYEDGYCPKCGSLPNSYELDGAAYCGLHHCRMIPYRLTSNFLFQNPSYQRDSHRFPHARLWGEARANENSVEGSYCEACDAAFSTWAIEHGWA